MKPVDPKNRILGDSGWGGAELKGYRVALLVEGKTLIISGCEESVTDSAGNQLMSEDGSASYGYRWYDVHFESRGEFRDENSKRFICNADDWSSDQDHQIAVNIAFDYLTNFRSGRKNRPKTRSIEFSQLPIWTDGRFPKDVLRVNVSDA